MDKKNNIRNMSVIAHVDHGMYTSRTFFITQMYHIDCTSVIKNFWSNMFLVFMKEAGLILL